MARQANNQALTGSAWVDLFTSNDSRGRAAGAPVGTDGGRCSQVMVRNSGASGLEVHVDVCHGPLTAPGAIIPAGETRTYAGTQTGIGRVSVRPQDLTSATVTFDTLAS